MILTFDEQLISSYKSPSQKIRVLSEHWVDSQIYCPNCGHQNIDELRSNMPVADFHCANCQEVYELKSKKNSIGRKVLDGAYRTMIERLTSSTNPNIFLLNYNPIKLSVIDFFVIPKHFFIPEIIEKRKPLAQTARRAGWVGCNILLQNIPQAGRIFFVKESHIEPKEKVIHKWKKTLFLTEEKEVEAKGWMIEVMHCVEKIGRKEFVLDDVYQFENELRKIYPNNKHIKAKIRQQLQILRDKGYLDFVSSGNYRLL